MNNDIFLRNIENTRDCGQDELDTAVKKGLKKAIDDRFDMKKLLMLTAAFIFTFAVFFTVKLTSFEFLTDEYFNNWNNKISGVTAGLGGEK